MRNKSIIGFGAILFLLVVLLVSAAISYVTIYDPADLSASGWINGTNDTIDFRFNWTGGPIALANCTLYIDDDNYGNESNVLENVTTTILANKTLDNGTHTWYVNCSNNNGSMSSSENIIGIDNLAPISSTDAPSEWKSVSSIIVNFTSDNDDLSPITNYSCQGVGCTPTAANSQTINSEGNNTVKYFSGDDARNNETPIKTAYVLLDTSNPTMNLSNPIDSYTYLDQNNFNFTFNVTDAYSNTLDCDLIINGVLNETNSTVQNDTKTEFVNKFLADGNYNWNISCEDLAGNNNTSETKSFTVDVTPDKPVIFTPINLTSDTRINIYGYVNRSGLNTNVTVYAQQEASQYINSTLTTETSSKTGTATINESQIAGNGFFYINKEGSLPAGFGVGNFTEFSNHQPPNWERYEIIDTTEFADRYQINITPSLREDINTSDSVSAYNQSKPTGWFNVSVPLFSGNNTIQVDAKRLENYGPVSDSFNTFSDITAPTINLSLVTNYTINNAKINFSISDDYVLNVSTVVANISGTIYNSTNVSCSGTATQQECSLNANLTNSYHNITVSINDVIGNSNTSEKKQFLVNSQTPIVSLELLADNYEEDDNNNITLSFNVTDIFDQSLNCSIYINTILNNTNETVQNGTSTGVQLDNLTDGEYNWDVSCENDLGLTNTSETRTFTISNTPEKAGIWLYESLIDTNIANIIGVIGKNNTLVNATIEQGELIPYNNYTTSTQDSELNLITTTLKQQASQGEYCVYVNKTLNESFIPGRWIEFVNHNKSNAYFERYNITNRTNDWGEGENAFYTRVCMQENLTATVPTTTSISVYDTNYPKGWFNITLSLREGENNITLEGSRLGLIGQDSDLITIFYDNSAPTINLSTIPGNLTTNTPTITFVLEDDYNVSLPTLLLNISNSTNSTMHVWDQETAHNISSWEMGANISCSGNRYLQTCSLTQSLSDDTYNLSFTINDTINHQITDNKAIIIAATISGSSEINDTGATTDNRFMLNVSWTNTTSEQYFDHYELAVGTETYPNNGYDNEETWFAVGNNVSYEITNLTLVPGEMYYVHLKSVNTFGVNST
ncbi:hypothetical protein CMO90_01170, partial [Candidatus Woesearchaeota archaeon]|nr:hypothetical protein [Candidatus Woesearchaeota archaeon]